MTQRYRTQRRGTQRRGAQGRGRTNAPPQGNVSVAEDQRAVPAAPLGGGTVDAVELPASISVRQLAEMLKAPPIEVIKQLMRSGTMAAINEVITYEAAAKVTADRASHRYPQGPHSASQRCAGG